MSVPTPRVSMPSPTGPRSYRSHLSSSISKDPIVPPTASAQSIRAQTAQLAEFFFENESLKNAIVNMQASSTEVFNEDETGIYSPGKNQDDITTPLLSSKHSGPYLRRPSSSLLSHQLRVNSRQARRSRSHPSEVLQDDASTVIASDDDAASDTCLLLPSRLSHYDATVTKPHIPLPYGDVDSNQQQIYVDNHVYDQSEDKPQQFFLRIPAFYNTCCQKLTMHNAQLLVSQIVYTFPAVVLGALLNILDALSYGLILFPVGTRVFSDTGPDGISIFYISCIVSQLVYSCGASAFAGGVGSEMIEVVPFFHQMAHVILNRIGDTGDNDKAILASTIVAFSLSSILTGLIFLFLGAANLGRLVGFFPRHILLGCIGGVGWFLFITGVQVSVQWTGEFRYDLETLRLLRAPQSLKLLSAPMISAIILLVLQKFYDHPHLVPLYFMFHPVLFYIGLAAFPNWNLEDLREQGWLFAAPRFNQPWWNFITYFDFKIVDWKAIADTLPIMFALAFFGILHVPINVPALAISTNEDNLDINRELVAHGISNALSGMLGSVQNYLVYSNSILFIRSGGNNRIAGLMLAVATAAIMFVGPAPVGYIPVTMVASLIFVLGISLMLEALYDTWNRVSPLEYLTIVTTVVSMAVWDFVSGILVGLLLSSFFFMLRASKKPAIRATYTGLVAKSTVRRHPLQQKFLNSAGYQIFVCRLSGYLFFGTITGVESKVQELLSARNFRNRPIRFLLMDFALVSGVDYSAGETFIRIKRSLDAHNVVLVFCGMDVQSNIVKSLRSVGLWSSNDTQVIQLFGSLNAGLESCENEILQTYYHERSLAMASVLPKDLPPSQLNSQSQQDETTAEQDKTIERPIALFPRQLALEQAADAVINEEVLNRTTLPNPQNYSPPVPLLIQTFDELTTGGIDFFLRIAPLFQKEVTQEGTVLFEQGSISSAFYIVESGILRATYSIDGNHVSETIVAGTVCGELPFLSETCHPATVISDTMCVLWKLDRLKWKELVAQEEGYRDSVELIKIALRVTEERLSTFIQSGLILSK